MKRKMRFPFAYPRFFVSLHHLIKHLNNMKRLLFTAAIATLALAATAQNLQKGDYGYLYCHMSDRGEYTAYAISRDGYNYEDIIGGRAVIDPKVHARIEGGQRDAFIARSWTTTA
jgi:hypothetical protein